MITHKCDGCRYKGEHVEMGFKPFGVCYKETNLIEAEKNYNAETCPYKQNESREIKTPYDDKIAEAARILRGEEKTVYSPQLYKIKGDFAEIEPVYLPQLYETDSEPEAEPEQWPKENPYIKPLPEIEETDDIINLFGTAEEVEKKAYAVAEALATIKAAVEVLTPIIENIAAALTPVIAAIADLCKKIIDLYPNKRVVYLATHGKGRTKKKNINRILKWYERQGKTPRAKRRSRGFIRYVERDGKKWAVFVTY